MLRIMLDDVSPINGPHYCHNNRTWMGFSLCQRLNLDSQIWDWGHITVVIIMLLALLQSFKPFAVFIRLWLYPGHLFFPRASFFSSWEQLDGPEVLAGS